MPSMEQLMKKRLADAEKPKSLPIGNYVFAFDGYQKAQSKDEQWEFYRIRAKVVEPCDDVDPDDLEDFGPITGKFCQRTFISPTAEDADNDRLVTLDRMIKFCDHMGMSDEGKTVEQIFAEATGAQFLGQVAHQVRKDDPEAPPNVEIIRTAPVE